MSWHTDHMNSVAERWARKYRDSKLTEAEFQKRMKKTMLKYGWSESEANTIVSNAIKKGRA